MNKWRNRGLTAWRIRQLPRRRYRKAKETTDTCSICLEEFEEREYVRVLPCDHSEYMNYRYALYNCDVMVMEIIEPYRACEGLR